MPGESCVTKEAKGLGFLKNTWPPGSHLYRHRNPTRTFLPGTGPLPRFPRVEGVIATATILSGLASGAALATVVGF